MITKRMKVFDYLYWMFCMSIFAPCTDTTSLTQVLFCSELLLLYSLCKKPLCRVANKVTGNSNLMLMLTSSPGPTPLLKDVV